MADPSDIIRAAGADDEPAVRALLAADPALASARTMLGSGAVHAARMAGHDRIVDLLLEAGPPLDVWLAAELGMAEALAARLDRDPGLANAWSASGMTALGCACYWGQIEAARLLLDRGADPDLASRDGFLDIRPLGSAVATPDIPNPSDDEDQVVSLAGLLLDRGADVNGRRKDGMIALHTAAWRGHLKVIDLLLRRGADRTIAAVSGRHAGETPADTARSQGQDAAARRLASGQP
jgi:ankyrin repeat protein